MNTFDSKMLQILLIRPGATELDLQGRITGTLDVPLSEAGQKQADELAIELSEFPLTAIYTGPGLASQETSAQAVPRWRNQNPCRRRTSKSELRIVARQTRRRNQGYATQAFSSVAGSSAIGLSARRRDLGSSYRTNFKSHQENSQETQGGCRGHYRAGTSDVCDSKHN